LPSRTEVFSDRHWIRIKPKCDAEADQCGNNKTPAFVETSREGTVMRGKPTTYKALIRGDCNIFRIIFLKFFFACCFRK